MDALQFTIHYSLHLLVPGLLAYILFRKQWITAWPIMIATMIVDIDHIYACKTMFPIDGGFIWPSLDHLIQCNEIFVPDRCSIGFHPLHSVPAIGVYILLLLFPKTRIIAVGLLFHMMTDYQDCLW